jgi:outer membrane protein insertion porin family
MPKHRMCKSGGWHFAIGVAAVLSVMAVLEPVVYSAQPAQAQSGAKKGKPAQAQGGGIRTIRVEGNRRVEPETVRTYLRFNVGDAYDPAKVDQSIKSLFSTGLFSDVRIDREGAGVVVTVVENPVVNQVAFEGNREVDKNTLTAEVQLKPRSVFTRAKAQADVQRILDIYRRQGRFAASVDPKVIELDNNRVNVVYEIVEGGATKVQAINFIGNKAFSDSQLRDVITTSQSGLFDFIKGTNIYDPDRLALDRELLRQYYLKNGYADSRVVSAGAELARDGSGFYITYVVDEGELFTFGKVDIESTLAGVDPGALRGELQTASGTTYDQSAMDRTVERLTLAISEQGFAFARVRPRAVREPGSRVINITYVVDQGPRIYIERINVAGNLRTHDHVIRREFRLAEGDAYNPLLVDKAKRRLQGLGFFKAVDIKRRQGSSADRVVLDVELVEQSTGELSFGAGFSTSEGIIGDVSIAERNLLGKGQFLRLRLAGSFERLQADISFTEPRFLDRNLSAGFDLFWKEVDLTDVAGFKSRTEGGSLRLGFPLSESLWLTNTYTLSNGTIFDVNDDASVVIQNSEGSDLTSSYGISLAYDQRNNSKNPTKGYFFQIGTDFAGLGGDVRYIRNTAEARFYYPITDKLTFVGRAIGGNITGWGGDDVRLLDHFFKGGETVRGFERGGFGPRDLKSNDQDALGGETFWATTAEVRFPLPFIPEDLGLGGAFFVDAGSLFGAGQLADDLNRAGDIILADEASVRASAGFSIMWNSPLGPLRLDIAKAFLKERFDREELVRFGASTKF